MKKEVNQNHLSFDLIARKLVGQQSDLENRPEGNKTRASVAMILHQTTYDMEILFIQRAAHDLDPWSGHIAFPGGKIEAGELECQAASRETFEEIGIDLTHGNYLGRLSDVVGANLPVRVSCCLFGIDRQGLRPVLNEEEVRDVFWVSLADLREPERHILSKVTFDEKHFEVPAIKLPVENKPVLWGITYRLVMQFLSSFEDRFEVGERFSKLPLMVEFDEEV